MVNKTTRFRGTSGHNIYFNKLDKELSEITEEIDLLEKEEKPSKRELSTLKRLKSSLQRKIETLIRKCGQDHKETFNYCTRLSVQIEEGTDLTEHQKNYAKKLFDEVKDYESQGLKVPKELDKKIETMKATPDYETHMDILTYYYASLCKFDERLLENIPYEMFLSQSDINITWLEFQDISREDVIDSTRIMLSMTHSDILKGKRYLFIGAFVSYTADVSFAECILKIVKENELDGIIVAGPWTKEIYLHKTFGKNVILNIVKKILKETDVIAIRANQEEVDFLPELRKLGVTFVNSLENDKNIFFGSKITNTSTKDQFTIYRDLDISKNMFCYTSYVGFETQLKQDQIIYRMGSGSASVNTPRSRFWSKTYTREVINSMKYDSTGGHLLTFDEESNVSVNSFHFNRVMDGVPLQGKFYPVEGKSRKCRLAFLASDLHIQHMDMYCFTGFLYNLEKMKDSVDILYLNGDVFDNALLSHWDEKRIGEQIKNKIEFKSFLHEVARAREALRMIVSRVNPGTQLYFKWGNHEVNSLNKLKDKSLIHFLDNILNLEDLLGLEDLGFKTIDSRESFKLGDISMLHGHEMSPAQARRNFGRKNIRGHSHQCKIDNNGIVLPSMQRNDTADYMPYAVQNWSPGWAISSIVEGIIEKPELILMHDEKSYYDFEGRVHIDTPLEIVIPKKFLMSWDLL